MAFHESSRSPGGGAFTPPILYEYRVLPGVARCACRSPGPLSPLVLRFPRHILGEHPQETYLTADTGIPMKSSLLSFAALLVSSPLLAQGTLAPSGAGLSTVAQPSAISGMASSARHCVSGDAANVHGIGWMDAGTGYAITFDAEFPLVAAVSRLDLDLGESTGLVGTPDMLSTATTPGSMVLFVGTTGNGGCYRY